MTIYTYRLKESTKNLNYVVKNVFWFLSIIADGLILSYLLFEYTYSLARISGVKWADQEKTHETEPLFLYRPIHAIKSE